MAAQKIVKTAARTAAGLGAALLAAAGVAALAVPAIRHYVVARLNDPAGLPALASDSRVRFEQGAKACAEAVAALLPGAVARIEAAQGRPFAAAPIVAVFSSYETYGRANSFGTPFVAGVSWSGRVTLSPALCGDERVRLPGVLTHELSHSHFFGWRSEFLKRPPSWFTEGLAVFASDGGGAEGVSDARAVDAIRDGYAIVVDDDTLWPSFAGIAFAREPPRDPASADPVTPRQRLAYRQASMFVAFLSQGDPQAFAAFLDALYAGERFEPAFEKAFRAPVATAWARFVQTASEK